MTDPSPPAAPALTVILPASNEEAQIGACLEAVLASDWDRIAPLQVVVVVNGSVDETAAVVRGMGPGFERRGWPLDVIELDQGGKLGALNSGDGSALAGIRVYLDADVTIAPTLLRELYETLDTEAPRYASGQVQIAAPDNWASRAYARIWRQVPFMTTGVPGCGVFAVNAAGRARWGAFPDIISDDTFARLNFAPTERIGVAASYRWPIVEGLTCLIRVRARQDRGVAQIAETYPDLLANDDTPPFPTSEKLRIALRDPLGFAVYSGVAVAVRLGLGGSGWSRGR